MGPLISREARLDTHKFYVDLPMELSGLIHDPPPAPLAGGGLNPTASKWSFRQPGNPLHTMPGSEPGIISGETKPLWVSLALLGGVGRLSLLSLRLAKCHFISAETSDKIRKQTVQGRGLLTKI